MCSLYVILVLLPLCQSILHQPHNRKGSTAARIFMKGAVKSKTKNAGYTVYVKDGSKETACREFLASVTDQNTIKGFSNLHGKQVFAGRAGDRIFHYMAQDALVGNKPTITIFDPKQAWSGRSDYPLPAKIIYE